MSMVDSGTGWQTPEDTNSDMTAVAFIVRQMMARLDTMKLVKVMAVTGGGTVAAPGTVNVQPLVSQIDGATPPNPTPHGLVYGIPWSRTAGGKNAVICDPAVGDIGYVVCADRDGATALSNGTFAAPGSQRRYSIADGVYVSMGWMVTPTQYLIFTATGVRLVDLNGNSVSLGSSGINLTDLNGNMLVTSGSGFVITTVGDFVVNGISVLNHTHGGVTTGTGFTGLPVG